MNSHELLTSNNSSSFPPCESVNVCLDILSTIMDSVVNGKSDLINCTINNDTANGLGMMLLMPTGSISKCFLEDLSLYPPSELSSTPASTCDYICSNNSSIMPGLDPPANVSEVTEFFKSTVKALYIYAVPIICVLGIIGDIVSFCIFTFTSFQYQPCSQYLAALSLVDTLFLKSQLISSLMTFFPVLALAPGSCSVMVFLSYVCSFLSAWFVVLMMVERYLVVCHPFRASTISIKKKAVAFISGLTVFAILLYCHSFFTTVSKSGHRCQVDPKYYLFVVIFTYIDSFLTFVCPFLFIVVLNLRIILTVRKFRLRQSLIHRSIYRSQRYYNAEKTLSLAQVRSTKMLLRVSSVFVVLYMPSYAIRLYGMLLQQLGGDNIDPDTNLKLLIAQQLCHVLYYVNFAVDFLVFFATSSNFRRHVSRCFKSRSGCKYRYC